MSATSEYEAAYFTLLRALEERDDLLRYSGYLEREVLRLDAFVEETRTAAEEVAAKVRRPIDLTQRQLMEAVGRRREAVLAEQRRMDSRLEAATAFVEECEAEVASLRP